MFYKVDIEVVARGQGFIYYREVSGETGVAEPLRTSGFALLEGLGEW